MESQDGTQNVTKESTCIKNIKNHLTGGGGKNVAGAPFSRGWSCLPLWRAGQQSGHHYTATLDTSRRLRRDPGFSLSAWAVTAKQGAGTGMTLMATEEDWAHQCELTVSSL